MDAIFLGEHPLLTPFRFRDIHWKAYLISAGVWTPSEKYLNSYSSHHLERWEIFDERS